jgi:hypothetical protein
LEILGIENRKLKIEKISLFPSWQQIIFFKNFFLFFFRVRADAHVHADAVFTASADGKNPSAGKTASAG